MAVGRVHRIVWAIALLMALIPIAPASARALEPVSAPDVTAQAAYVYDATANVELLSLNSDVARAPASTVKIVTAMVVLDNVDTTDQQVTVDAEDVTDPTSGESSMLLNAGEEEHTKGSRVALMIGVPGLLIGAATSVWVLSTRSAGSGAGNVGQLHGSAQVIGKLLFRDFLLPFEVTSVLILIAIMGAVVLARRSE